MGNRVEPRLLRITNCLDVDHVVANLMIIHTTAISSRKSMIRLMFFTQFLVQSSERYFTSIGDNTVAEQSETIHPVGSWVQFTGKPISCSTHDGLSFIPLL